VKSFYPWHTKQWQQLQHIAEINRLSHALLFSGREGLGVEQLAFSLAAQALCEGASVDACGECRGCKLFLARSHPDFKMISPADQGRSIVVDQVREVNQFYTLKSHYAQAKVVMIYPANAMNRASSNAILKILEEPPDGALVLLVTHRFSAISMTIRSRCVRVPCEQIDSDVALSWLANELPELDENALNRVFSLSGGTPLGARELANNGGSDVEIAMVAAFKRIAESGTHVLTESKNFSDLPLSELQRHMNSLILRLILAKFGLSTHHKRTEPKIDDNLQGLVDHLNLKNLYALLDLIVESKTLSSRQSGLRETDLAETLWLGLSDCAHTGPN
jgi:DNA polymerase-3 subunit delta'